MLLDYEQSLTDARTCKSIPNIRAKTRGFDLNLSSWLILIPMPFDASVFISFYVITIFFVDIRIIYYLILHKMAVFVFVIYFGETFEAEF